MSEISVVRWAEISDADRARIDIDEIFFEASAKKTFLDSQDRTVFRERWLGRYLAHYSDWFYVARLCNEDSCAGRVVGYLAGCIDDPRKSPIFSDIGYFSTFREHLDRYPAHLHINLAPEFRGSGLGGRLVMRFLSDAANAGSAGVHVVTSASSRNVSFYRRVGFDVVATSLWDGKETVFLGARAQ